MSHAAVSPLLPLEPGPWQDELDGQATALLKADRVLRQVVALNDKKDWLTDDQLRIRLEKEVYASHPIDRLIESGLYRRAFNPLAGKRPNRRGRFSLRQDPWRQDVYESFDRSDGVFLPCYQDSVVESGVHYTWDIMLPHTHSASRPAAVL